MEKKLNFLGSNSLKKHKGQQILFSSKIQRFDECDEQSEVEIYITQSYVLLRDEKTQIREFQVEDIESLTLSDISPEFILHMYEEYDERLAAPTNRRIIIEMLLYLLTTQQEPDSSFNDSLPVYLVKDLNLDMYVTTEEDLEDGHTIRPEDSDMKMLSYYDYIKREEERAKKLMKERRSTRTLYSTNKEKVTKDDFILHKVLGKGAHGKVILCS